MLLFSLLFWGVVYSSTADWQHLGALVSCFHSLRGLVLSGVVTVQGGIKKTSNMKSHVISTKTSLDWIYTG